MLETIAIPILFKAVNFLFEECRNILDERRERRKQEQPKVAPPEEESPAMQPDITSKEAALKLPVDPNAWLKAESQVGHLLALLEIHVGNYRLLQKQYAAWTEALVPPVIASGLKNEENKIAEISMELQILLSEVYAQKVNVIKPEEIERGG
jgi:hypothetical protein